MNVRRHGIVLEVGSGDNPHPRSDILCDRYLTTNRERAGGFGIRVDRPMVVADGMRLPFADKTFDYAIASHIFEHMEDPVGFARELARVAKAGYVEVPSALAEQVFGWDFHHWYCAVEDGVLTFTPKTQGERWGGFFHRLIARHLWFRRWFEEHEDAWYVRLEWKGAIPVAVRKRPVGMMDERAWALLSTAKPQMLPDTLFAIRFFLRRAARKARSVVRRALWRVFPSRAWMALLVCVVCRGKLQRDGQELLCGACRARYPMDGDIPILLEREERESGY